MDKRVDDQGENADRADMAQDLILHRLNQLTEENARLATQNARLATNFKLLSVIVIALSLVVSSLMTRSLLTDPNEVNEIKTNRLIAEQIILRRKGTKSELAIFFSKDNPAIGFYDENGKNRMILNLDRNGDSVIAFFDSRDQRRVSLFSRSENGKIFSGAGFEGSDGTKLLSLGAGRGELPFIQLYDGSGQNRVGIQVQEDQKTVLQIISSDGKRGILLLTDPDSQVSTLKIQGKGNDVYSVSK